MSNYNEIKKQITSTLTERPANTMIYPDKHQEFALAILEYCHNLELLGGSTLMGIAYPNTQPIQPETSKCAYIAGAAQGRTTIFTYFKNDVGESISVTTQPNEAKLVILLWNREYWEVTEVSANVITQVDTANYFYRLTIRKTYASYAEMIADTSPVGNDGISLSYGEIVSIHNPNNHEEDAIYSYESDGWQFQTKLSYIEAGSRTIDGGRADSVYGGALNYDCGGA